MRMNPPRGMGGMGPQVGSYLCSFSPGFSSGSQTAQDWDRLNAVTPLYSPVLEAEFSSLLSLSVLLVLGKRGAAQIGSWCSICSTNWVERRTKARVRAKLPQAWKALSHFALHPRAADRWAAVCLSRTSLA